MLGRNNCSVPFPVEADIRSDTVQAMLETGEMEAEEQECEMLVAEVEGKDW